MPPHFSGISLLAVSFLLNSLSKQSYGMSPVVKLAFNLHLDDV